MCLCFCPQSQAYEFQFGLEYAWSMCIVAVSMTYSITCPIIMPFGEQNTITLFLVPFVDLVPVCAVSPRTVTSPAACQYGADYVNWLLLSQTPRHRELWARRPLCSCLCPELTKLLFTPASLIISLNLLYSFIPCCPVCFTCVVPCCMMGK